MFTENPTGMKIYIPLGEGYARHVLTGVETSRRDISTYIDHFKGNK